MFLHHLYLVHSYYPLCALEMLCSARDAKECRPPPAPLLLWQYQQRKHVDKCDFIYSTNNYSLPEYTANNVMLILDHELSSYEL